MAIVGKKRVAELDTICANYSISAQTQKDIERHRREIEEILSGRDDRMLVIVGPCSAWPSNAVLEYARRLKDLSVKVEDKVKMVMRVYTQKPRTTKGWAGPIVQPDPFKPADVQKGAIAVRSMMIQIAEMGLPIADELLFTHKTDFIGDLLSWAAIGARSVEDQEHRVFASGLSIPVGMKNATSGNIDIAINSIISAQGSHTYYSNGYQYETDGNSFAHVVLRGGLGGPNYSAEVIEKVGYALEAAKVENRAIIVDASHDNTLYEGVKDYLRQKEVIASVLKTTKDVERGGLVKGFLIESFIEEGNQSLNACAAETINRNGLSITDPCLGWEETEEVIMAIAGKNS